MNYVTPSAVSQAISKLEIVFGTELIFLNRQKIQITEEGLKLFEEAKNIFRAVQETFESIQKTKETIMGTLKFGTTKSLGMSFIAPSYLVIKKHLPQLELHFWMGGLNKLRTALKREEIEFAIVVYDHNFEQFDRTVLRRGCFNLYQSKEKPDNLIDQGVFVDYNEGSYVAELKRHLQNKGWENPIRDTLSGWELTARFTELGYGVGFFPDYLVANDRYQNLKALATDLPPFDYEICVIYNKGSKLSRAAQAFLQHFTFDEDESNL